MSSRKRRRSRSARHRGAKRELDVPAASEDTALARSDTALLVADSAAQSGERDATGLAPAKKRAAAAQDLPARQRPPAPWHPLPLSELLILVGCGAVAFSVITGPQHSAVALLVGLAVVVIGTLEVTLREHLSGYRSHALLLAVLPVVVLHSVLVLSLSALASFPRVANVGLLAIDLALVFVLHKLLRARYLEARRRDALARRSESRSARA
jgi:hypothetical protein